MHKKKRIFVFLLLVIFFGIYLSINVNAQCPPGGGGGGGGGGRTDGGRLCVCSSGQVEQGADCGPCGSRFRRDCDGCGWGGWYCQNSAPSNYGQACGNGGTRDCNGNCVGETQGVCSHGQTETRGCGSGGTQARTCQNNKQWGNWGACTGERNEGQTCDISNWDGYKVDACWDENGNANCDRIQDSANWWCQNRCGQQKALSYGTSWTEGIGTKYVPTGRVCSTCSNHFSSLTCGSGCVSNQGQQCNCGPCGCGGTIQCDGSCSGSIPTPGSYGQSCGKCGTIDCSGSCTNQGPCSPGSTQCSGGRYQACNTGCQWQNSGTDADKDGTDKQCGDSQCDNSPGVTDATKTPTEIACTDGLDNDCDGKTDCNDSDCNGSIAGNVKNQDNQPISSADVSAKKDLTTVASATTSQQGSYSIGIGCGTYNVIASHPDYAPKTINNLNVPEKQQVIADFTLVLGTSCEADCTFASDDIIHDSCDGKNGCKFPDNNVKVVCNNAQPGWIRDYNATHYVICPFGSPQPKIEVEASVTCPKGTLVKMTRIVIYNGKPVKLVVAACG